MKSATARDARGDATGQAIEELAVLALSFLERECDLVDLVSRVPDKRYVGFRRQGGPVTRAANARLLETDPDVVRTQWTQWRQGAISVPDFARFSYTSALAPCLAMEIFDRQNKKGPATYFECFVEHLFARVVGADPERRARLRVEGRDVLLTMDLLFRPTDERPGLHVPVKMSTRERVVQAWAHQALLDASFGRDEYRGVMVLFAETKLDARSLEVVEICVPDQWLAYQTLLARMDRIYYFDVPARYQELTENYPQLIVIRPFGQFAGEREVVLRSRGLPGA